MNAEQPPNYASIVAMTRDQLWQRYNRSLDWLTPHALARWLGLLVCLALYGMRVWFLQGFYIVTYALGIFLLNNLIGFVTPQVRGVAAGRQQPRVAALPREGVGGGILPPQPVLTAARAAPHAHPPPRRTTPHTHRWTRTLRAPRCRATPATTPSPPSRRAWASSSSGSCPWRARRWPLP